MKKRNYFIAFVCGLVCMCGMSSCCAVMDAIYGPPYHHHCPPPPPPPRYHHHHHYRYFSDVSVETTTDYDLAVVDVNSEQTTSVL